MYRLRSSKGFAICFSHFAVAISKRPRGSVASSNYCPRPHVRSKCNYNLAAARVRQALRITRGRNTVQQTEQPRTCGPGAPFESRCFARCSWSPPATVTSWKRNGLPCWMRPARRAAWGRLCRRHYSRASREIDRKLTYLNRWRTALRRTTPKSGASDQQPRDGNWTFSLTEHLIYRPTIGLLYLAMPFAILKSTGSP